jgi:hypothetical protein
MTPLTTPPTTPPSRQRADAQRHGLLARELRGPLTANLARREKLVDRLMDLAATGGPGRDLLRAEIVVLDRLIGRQASDLIRHVARQRRLRRAPVSLARRGPGAREVGG